MVSEEAFSSGVSLGYKDAICSTLTSGTAAFTEADLDENGSLDDMEKSIYSYNHAIERLNSACASLIADKSKIAIDENSSYKIRSVGSNPTNPSSENATLFTSTFMENNPQNNATYEPGYFDEKGKNTDTNYVSDYEMLVKLGKTISANEKSYYLASRFVFEMTDEEDEVDFSIRRVVLGNCNECSTLWSVSTSKAAAENEGSFVRPVITLKSGLTFEYNSEDGGYFTIEE